MRRQNEGVMQKVKRAKKSELLNEQLSARGFRFTSQRQHVYEVLMGKRDHPTAEEVYLRSKRGKPEISIATVYNCLDALVKCNLVKQVKSDRVAVRYCPNMNEHSHFHCDGCGRVQDVDCNPTSFRVQLPQGFRASQYELSMRGLCSDCTSKLS